jgi:hypothetical protein
VRTITVWVCLGYRSFCEGYYSVGMFGVQEFLWVLLECECICCIGGSVRVITMCECVYGYRGYCKTY